MPLKLLKIHKIVNISIRDFARNGLKIPLAKISAKFSFLAVLKISCKILKNGGGVGKIVKSIFRKIAN